MGIALVNAPHGDTLNNRKKRKNIKQAATDRYDEIVTNEDKKYSRHIYGSRARVDATVEPCSIECSMKFAPSI